MLFAPGVLPSFADCVARYEASHSQARDAAKAHWTRTLSTYQTPSFFVPRALLSLSDQQPMYFEWSLCRLQHLSSALSCTPALCVCALFALVAARLSMEKVGELTQRQRGPGTSAGVSGAGGAAPFAASSTKAALPASGASDVVISFRLLFKLRGEGKL